jgi:hypothetical protein
MAILTSHSERPRSPLPIGMLTVTDPAPAGGSSVEHVLQRIRGEFLEMPGLRLTIAQAQRLWHLDALVCESLLAALVDTQFLVRTVDGAFLRSDQTLARTLPRAV